jgi:hypothetical protein
MPWTIYKIGIYYLFEIEIFNIPKNFYFENQAQYFTACGAYTKIVIFTTNSKLFYVLNAMLRIYKYATHIYKYEIAHILKKLWGGRAKPLKAPPWSLE